MQNNPQVPPGIWKRASFTVPAETPDERIQFVKDRYMSIWGTLLEQDGWTVLEMRSPHQVRSYKGIDAPDRKRYAVWAWCIRGPITYTVDMPDEWVTEAKKFGFRLKE